MATWSTPVAYLARVDWIFASFRLMHLSSRGFTPCSSVRPRGKRGTEGLLRSPSPGRPRADISQPMSAAERESLYEKVLRQLGAAGRGGPKTELPPPRASAAVVPWRRKRAGEGIEVYWVQRSPELP